MEKQRRRDVRGIVGKVAAVVFAAGFVLSIVPAIRALAEGTIFKIQSAEITEISAGATGNISTYDEQNIVSNVTFHKINDSVSYKIVLKNSDTKDYVIESITDDNTSEQISYAYDDHAGETIAAGADLDFLLTAKFVTPVTDMTKRAMASNVKFFIKFAEKEEPEEIDIVVPDTDDETPEEPEEIDIVVPNTDAGTPVVPDTGANTKDSKGAGISLATMIISVVGLTVLAFIAVKKHKKYAKIIGVAVVAVSAFGLVTSARAANIETNSFTLTTNYGFYDKLVIKNGDKDVVIDYGGKLEDVDEITEPTKPGYTFDGWEDENGNPVDPTKPITEDITIKPKFVANTYTVKFDANGGDGTMADVQFTYDEAQALTANAFSFTGREYTGWDTKPNGSGVHYDDKAEVKNLTTENNGIITLYAQWSINPFHINYDGNGATSGEMATTNCEYDEACELRDNAFEKYGYDFAGWKYNDTIYADKADVTNIIDHGTITMQAQWTPHVYTIAYTGLTDEEAAALRTAGNPDNYTIETTSFTLIKPADRKDADGDVRERCIGWRDVTVYEDVTLPISNALSDKTYEAVWQTVALEEFDITYDYDGGNVATANPEKLNKEQSATLNEPVKTGYTFTGWTGTTIEGSTPVKPYTIPAPHQKGNLAYTAHYRANNYTIAFDGNGATSGSTASMSMTYDEAKNLTANGFARTGYTFAGWKLGDTNFTNEQEVNNLTAEDGATVTLKAQWAPIHYNVAFHQNADNVSGNMPSMTVAYDESTPLTDNTFALEHYKFMGWNSAEDGTGTPYEDKASIKNLTATDGATVDLYAQWKERTATLNTGANVRTALKGLADAPTTFKKYDGENLPDFDTLDSKVDIALADSNFPVWAWVDGDNIYWWSEAERPNFNSNSSTMFQSMTTLTTIDLDGLESSTAVNMGYLFNGCTSLTDLDISEFNTANVQNMMAMFYNTPALTSINTAVLNTANVNNMSFMFRDTGATSIDISNFNTVNVKTMQSMFENTKASSITLGNPNTLNVTNMANMFQDTLNITSLDVSGLDTDNVESMGGMFEAFKGTPKLTSLDLSNFKTGKVRNFQAMFYGQANLTNLDVSNFDTSSATTMYMMFLGMSKVQSINVSGWTNDQGPVMEYMFSYTGTSGTVINFDNFNTENVTNMNHMFSDMRSQTVLDLSSFDTAKVKNMSGMFSASYASTPMALKTVYVSDKFVTTALTGTQNNIFDHTRAIVGGAGTAWDASSMEKARIDDPDNSEPGYFTMKGARYIRYNGNGADNATPYGAMTSEYLKAGDSLKKNAFTRSGYEFAGWKDADGNDYNDEQIMTDLAESKTPLELYAHWEPMDVTITFHSNFDGVNDTMAQQTITVGEQNNLDANQYSVDHYRFLGWTTEPQGKVMGNESTAIDYADQASTAGFVGDTDLYAKWLYRCRTFATDSWNTIVTNLESDSTYYDATDVCEKEIQMDLDDDSKKETYGLRLINTSTPEECSTPGFSQTACGTVIEFTNYVGIWQWNSTNSTNGGWANATLATRLNGEDLYGKMPEELRSVIIPTYPIVSGANQNGVSPDITASDTNKNKIYLHTGKELGAPNSAFDDKEDLTRTYDFYGVSEHKPYRNREGGGGWSYDWWLRSALLSRDNIPLGIKSDVGHMISTTPGANSSVATYSAFRIGRKLTVSFNAGEGAASETAREYAVSAMNYDTLPTVTTAPEGKIFAGWYTAAEGGDRVNDNDTFVSSNAHTLYAHWITPTFYNITEMQQMTADICATATTPNTNASQFDTTGENVGNKSYIPRRELIDNRDGKSYQVTKLADGKCWMTENLAIGDTDSTMTLTPDDSDVSSDFTLPKSDITAFAGNSDVSAVYVDDTYGGYYSVKTANVDFAEYGKSICPKGWKLPISYNSGDWSALKRKYNIEEGTSSNNALYDEPFNYTRSFYVSNRRIAVNGWLDTAYIGPATDNGSFSTFGVTISDDYSGTAGITGAEGGSIRCVAR